VQDPLNSPPLGVLARHHAIAGRRQFGRLAPDLLDAPGQFRVEMKVVHAHRGRDAGYDGHGDRSGQADEQAGDDRGDDHSGGDRDPQDAVTEHWTSTGAGFGR